MSGVQKTSYFIMEYENVASRHLKRKKKAIMDLSKMVNVVLN